MFREFCQKAIGTGREAPLRDINGATINALTRAFHECFPIAKAKTAPELPDFEAEAYNSPWTVYVIRNERTQEVYIGMTEKGFATRYPGGKWWVHSTNTRLTRDALMFGVRNFRIAIHACSDEKDMRRLEATLQRLHRPMTYNEKPEQDNHIIGDDDE
jgi:predicted GIY-YIG superfamily endonuclease